MNDTVLSLDQLQRLMKITLPPTNLARGGWEFDPDAIGHACELLQIEYPVSFRFTNGQRRIGTHHSRGDSEPYHSITISQDLPIEKANKVVWHELAHASQSEAWVRATGRPHNRFFREFYMKLMGPHGQSYEGNKMEKHAQYIEKTHAERMLLRPVK